MPINSRKKGAAGERELARILKEYGFSTRRGQQFSGANGDADVIGLPKIHIECKRVEKLNIDNALLQAVNDAYADSLKQGIQIYPAVFHRRNNTHSASDTIGRWKVTMLLDDWIQIYKKYIEVEK